MRINISDKSIFVIASRTDKGSPVHVLSYQKSHNSVLACQVKNISNHMRLKTTL